ncbi:alpha/beta hydrolase [Novosphingobium sp.]|uniref:alpha/beta hydrolase n=1 Tax=Novosphingobium sp. TaxID=1874826 RepID=UPI0031CF0E65
MSDVLFHPLPADGEKPARRLAYRLTPPADSQGKTLVFLPGYMSDMAGSKAAMLFDAAREQGIGCLLLDYSGCGASDGDFPDGTLTRWREEVLALIAALIPGPVVLVGSSMGGWLMLLVAQALPAAKLAGIMGIAAAPDFTQWGYTSAQKGELIAGRTIFEPNPYGPEPTPTHARFWTDGEHNRLLDAEIPLDVPAVLIHGQRDEDVPWEISLRLSATLRSDAVQLCLVKDGDHRLSRPVDLALIRRMALALAGADA